MIFLLTIMAMAVVAGALLWSGDAWAMNNTDNAWGVAIDKVAEAFQYSRKMIFVVGGFGLIALAFFAIFGKINWKWFAALCVGLGIVAIAGYVIDYVTIDASSGDVEVGSRETDNYSNTFDNH